MRRGGAIVLVAALLMVSSCAVSRKARSLSENSVAARLQLRGDDGQQFPSLEMLRR